MAIRNLKITNAAALKTAHESKFDSVHLEYIGVDKPQKGYEIETIKEKY